MRKPRKSHITRYGEGSFKYNPTRDLWVGRYDTGQLTPRRTRLYITVSARDEDTAWQNFTAAKKDFFINGPKLPEVKLGQTVQGWAKVWLPKHEKSVRGTTYATDRGNVTNWITPIIGTAKLDQLTAAHMRLVGDAPLKAGRSLSTANSAQRTLTKMLNAAKADGYQVPDRIFAQKKKGLGKSTRTRMSKTEVKAVFTQAYAMYPDAVRIFIAVLYGARQAEVLGLTWDRITYYDNIAPDSLLWGEMSLAWQTKALRYRDKTLGTFHINDDEEVEHIVDAWHFTRPKTDAGERVLPLIAPVVAELKKWRKECPSGEGNPWNLVFPRVRGKDKFLGYPRNPKNDVTEWEAAQRAAGVYKRHPDPKVEGDMGEFYLMHEARHSMISMLADEGVSRHVIAAMVGQTRLVQDYVHGDLEESGKAISLLAGLLPTA